MIKFRDEKYTWRRFPGNTVLCKCGAGQPLSSDETVKTREELIIEIYRQSRNAARASFERARRYNIDFSIYLTYPPPRGLLAEGTIHPRTADQIRYCCAHGVDNSLIVREYTTTTRERLRL